MSNIINTTPEAPEAPEAPAKAPIYKHKWVQLTGTALIALAIGSAMGGGSSKPEAAAVDTITTAEHNDLMAEQREQSEGIRTDLQDRLATANARVAELEKAAADKVAADQAAADQAATDQAAAAAAAPGANNQWKPGTYIVGTDIQPGRYRGIADVTGLCYADTQNGGSIGEQEVVDVGRLLLDVPNQPGTVVTIEADCGIVEKIG